MYPKLLLIEQTGTIRRLLEQIREFENFNFISTTEFSLAYQLCRSLSPHIIIVDFEIADFNKYLFSKMVNLSFQHPQIPLIAALTPEDTMDDLQALYAVDYYLLKPVNINQLIHVVRTYLPNEISHESLINSTL